MHRPRDKDPFTETFLACLPMLIGLVIRHGGASRDGVQDVLQDIWIKGAKAWPPREIAYARSWLGRIAINVAHDLRRRSARSPIFVPKNEEGTIDRPDPGPAADELLLHRDLHQAIAELERRSPRQVAVLRLIYLEGCTYTEAAAALDIAEGTAKSQAFKAVESLRLSLTGLKAA